MKWSTVSHGYGILVPALFFCSTMVSAVAHNAVMTDADETTELIVMLGFCAVIVTTPLWMIGRKVNHNNSDPHSFLRIPMEYWGIIWPIILVSKFWPK